MVEGVETGKAQAHAVLLGVHSGSDYKDVHLNVCCSCRKLLNHLSQVCVNREVMCV